MPFDSARRSAWRVDAAEAVEGIDFGVAARCVDDGTVPGLVEAGVAVGDVVHWVATSIGHQMGADAVSSCGFAQAYYLVNLGVPSKDHCQKQRCSPEANAEPALVTKTEIGVAIALDHLRVQESLRNESVPDRDANDRLSNINRILKDE
jgi:hypothetical protein